MMKKILRSILQKEGAVRRSDLVDTAVESANGDLRHAINSVQFLNFQVCCNFISPHMMMIHR